MLHWLKNQSAPSSPYPARFKEPQLLAMDAFRVHLTEPVTLLLKQLNITGSYIRGGCTGYVQVLDVALNQPFKALVKEATDLHYENHTAEWDAGGWATVGDRRVLLTKWVADAWRVLHERYRETIIKTFCKVGMRLNSDGSEDSELRVKALEGVKIGEWEMHRVDAVSQEQEAANVICRLGVELEAQKKRMNKSRKQRLAAPDVEVPGEAPSGDENGGGGNGNAGLRTQPARQLSVRDWQYFLTGAFEDFVPEIMMGKRKRASAAQAPEDTAARHDLYFTEAEVAADTSPIVIPDTGDDSATEEEDTEDEEDSDSDDLSALDSNEFES